MEADLKKANMPLKFISLLERWWELNRSGADKESGDIKAIVSFQREKEDRIYLFPARPLCREHLIFPLHLFFFFFFYSSSSSSSSPAEGAVRSRDTEPATDRQTAQERFISTAVCVSFFIYLIAYKKEKIYKRSV